MGCKLLCSVNNCITEGIQALPPSVNFDSLGTIPTMAQNTPKLKAILFDKDGTLFHYASVWQRVIIAGIDEAFASIGRSDDDRVKLGLLRLMGVDGLGNNLRKGLVFTHSKVKIARRFLLFCLRHRLNPKKVMDEYEKQSKESGPLLREILQATDFSLVQKLFAKLKEHNYTVAVITNDNEESTKLFLEEMKIQQYVDFVATRDTPGRKKPHPALFASFCTRFGLDPSEVAMVGDTITDMLFAKRSGAGYTVALLSGSNDHKRLSRHSDVIYPEISSLLTDSRLFSEE